MSFKIGLFSALLFVASCSQFTDKNTSDPSTSSVKKGLSELSLNLNVVKATLPNGMRVIIAENHKLPIFSLYTFFDVGGKYESPGTTGATHFLEHMMFKRTKNHETGYFSKFIEGNGGNTNAYTTFDKTVYYESLPSKSLDEMIELEAERLQNLVLNPKEFDSEKQVVLEERKMRYENRPNGQIYLAMMKAMFKGTPYGLSVIGSEEDVKNLSREKMMEFYDKFYKPNNAIMVIVGDVNAQKVIDTLKEKFDGIAYDKNLTELKKKLDGKSKYTSKAKLPIVKQMYGQSLTPLFSLSFPAPKYGDVDGYALDFLSYILSSGDSAYLNREFVSNKKPRVSSIYAGNYSLKNSGIFYIQGQLLEKKSLATFKRDLFRTLRRSCDTAITSRNLEKTKNQLLVQYYSNISTNDGLAAFLGGNEYFFNDYQYYKKELEIYNSMSVEKVKDVCKRYLNPKKSVFLSVWKKHAKR